MDATDWEPLKRLFEQAKELPAEEQRAFLETACADDPDKQAQLASLLEAADEADPFFDSLADAVLSLPRWSDASDVAQEPDPFIGRTVHQYRIEERLGSGGMGVVYRAHDAGLNRAVALKFLPPHLRSDDAATERFLVEARAAAALDHPNICNVYEIGEDEDGRLFIVMAFYEGKTLQQKLERGPFPIEEAWEYAQQIAAGLGAAHAHDIVHRDIKPGNVIVTSDGVVKVLDFGLAKLTDVTLTATGTTLGTVAYMSPEQARGDVVDHRADLWSLGVVLYEMLTGERPFKGGSTAVVLHAIQHENPRPPSALRSEVPPEIEAIVGRLLAKDSEQRPDRAEALGLGSGQTTALRGVFARPTGWARLRSWRGVAVLAVVIAGIGGWWFTRGPAYERLAVLPPANLMNDPEQEYFVQGVHTALISELQRAGVTVIARTSVMQYQNTRKPIREIASELGVDALVEASVFRAADSVEIEVSLVDGTTQQYVADPIVRRSDLRDVERLYRGLTAAIASEIQVELNPQAEAYLGTARPVNPQAYEAYLKGQSHWQRMTPTDREQALEYFQQALSLDSTYAAAQAGIALVWWVQGRTRGEAQASAAINRALALDSTLAEVQYAVALVRTWLEWDWEGGEAAFRKAIEINPNYADARAFYAGFLYIMERPKEGRAQIEKALELDPFNLLFRAMNGARLCYDHQYAEAIEELEAVLRIEPNHRAAIHNVVDAYHLNGNHEEALALVRTFYPRYPELEEALDRGYQEGGYRTAMRRYADALAARWEQGEQLDPVDVALIYAMAGEKERTLEWLEVAYQVRSINLPANLPASGLGPVPRDDTRYQALRRQVGLPP